MNLIEIEEKKIKLCTALSEAEFSKTRYSSLLGEKGLLAICENASSGSQFSFSDWSFSSIQSDQTEDKVYFTGELAQTDFTPLFKSQISIKTAELLLTALNQAEKQGLKVPASIGAALLCQKDDKITLLFLPQELFYNCASAFGGQDFISSYLMWENPLLDGRAAQSFTQAVLCYKALTGNFPYPNQNKDERTKDILDKKYLPLEYAVNGIDAKAAGIINRALTITKDSQNTLPKDFSTQILSAFDSAKNAAGQNTVSPEVFEKQKEEYLTSLNAKIERKRKIRRNSTKIIVAAAVFAGLLLLLSGAIKNHAEQPTTQGLSPTQVTECFFQSINEKDVQIMYAVAKGKAFKPYITAATNMHVANAASQAYTFSSINVAPEKWFFYQANEKPGREVSIYGISNLVIDGYNSLLDAKTNKNKDKPTPDTSATGQSIRQDISYYIVQTNGETGEIEVEYASGNVTLTWQKKCWLLTDIDVTVQPLNFSTQELKEDFNSSLEKNNGDVISAAVSLSLRYPWIPSRELLESEEAKLKEGIF